jgi:glycosyltransferase involved in cell wall biosynthesis
LEPIEVNTDIKISVIIPNYNYAQYVGQAIDSVLNQTYSKIEIIVVNNGSTDNSLDILKGFGDQICLVNQENLGQSGARNSGLLRATGDFIAFLDADDTWEPQKIEKQLLLFSPKTELVYCGIGRFTENNQKQIANDRPRFKGSCAWAFINFPGVSIVLSGESTAIFTRSLLEKVGGFDEDLNSAAGWDFFRRCSKLTDFDFVPEALTNYRLHSSNMSNNSMNTISDIRSAYKKLFNDREWAMSPKESRRTIVSLEYAFLKTHLKQRNFKAAIGAGMRMLLLRRY